MENGKVAGLHIRNCDIARTKQVGIFRTKEWWGKIWKIEAAWLRWDHLLDWQLSCNQTFFRDRKRGALITVEGLSTKITHLEWTIDKRNKKTNLAS